MPQFKGGSALPVTTGGSGPTEARAAVPVYVVSGAAPVLGQKARRVVVVTSGPVEGGAAMPVYDMGATAAADGDAALPVFVVSGSLGSIVLAYTNKVIALSPIAYWPLAEPSGSTALDASGNGRNGSYTNVTLGQTGIGDGRTAASFNGTTSFCNIYSASLNGAFTGGENTIAFWAKGTTDAVWSDGINRQLFRLFVDASNFVRFIKGADNVLNASYVAGGVSNGIGGGTPGLTGWNHIAFTTSKVANQRKLFINGAQVGSTATVGGTWAGNLSSTECAIGAANVTPVEVWNGVMAHAAVWSSALTPAQVASLAAVVP